ncbi:hypothetical protein BDQ17DRAFT_1346758 [Cyathus striatus]|nr:hypothetical protein BDQ17DRAFT_1346758 [Cyathus striatus]
MVNVNARLPFNLHNKNLSHTLDAHHTAASSSSRSASLSIHSLPKPSPSLSPLSNTPHTHTQVHAHVGAPLSFDPPTNASSTRSSSRDGADLEVYTRNRILNLRLVHRNGAGRRGRSRIKVAEGEDSAAANSNGVAAPEGGAAVTPIPTEGTSGTAAHLHVPPIDVSTLPFRYTDSGLYSPASTIMEGTPRAPVPLLSSLSTSPQQSRPTVAIGSARSFDFKIQDTGALCISWGD